MVKSNTGSKITVSELQIKRLEVEAFMLNKYTLVLYKHD